MDFAEEGKKDEDDKIEEKERTVKRGKKIKKRSEESI